MTKLRSIIAASLRGFAAASLLLTSCATQETLAPLHAAQMSCAVDHDARACAQVPYLQANANAEANHNGWITAGLILLLPLAVLAAGADAGPPPPPVFVPPPPRFR